MASVVSPVNSAAESVDSLITSAGTTGIMKGAVGARSVSGGDSTVAAVEVASQVDDAAFTPGTSTIVVIAGEADEAATDSVDEGDAGALRMTLDRRLYVASAGTVAHDAVDSGGPVKIGGFASANPPVAVADGDRVNANFSTIGALAVMPFRGAAPSDAISEGGVSLPWNQDATSWVPITQTVLFDGTNGFRERGNVDATVLASAARTATVQSADQTNYNGRGLHLVIDVTAITATPSVVFTIQGKDPLSGQYYTILASAAVVATGTTVLRVYPGLLAAANLTANDILPRTWRVDAVHGDTDSITYSVGASVIL